MQTIIRKPVITEKATMCSESLNRFTFEVDKKANKLEIKKAVEKMYGINVIDVRTMNYGGGASSAKYTNKGFIEQKSKQWKKAIVSVADGQTIDLFNNY